MKNLIYSRVREFLIKVYERRETISIGDLMDWVNKYCADLLERPYLSFRSVPGACWRRGNDYEREALEYTLTDKNGNPLL